MGFNRCTLHKNKLESFKSWLDNEGFAHRPGNGDWQVLQVLTVDSGWQVVFERMSMPEHFTVNEKLMPTVNRFIAASKSDIS